MNKYITRSIEKTVINVSDSFPVVMITGPRQVGKTTLLNFVSKSKQNIKYVSLDDIKLRQLAIEDPELFLETYETPLIIDEFQYAPNLLSYIKMVVDKKRLENLESNISSNGLYYLTGSQVFHTMKEIGDSLAGRVGILDLYGLSTREINQEEANFFVPSLDNFKKTKNVKHLSVNKLYERIIKGSYPELYVNNNIDKNMYYETYIRTYIERDIRDLINVKDEIKFMKFVSCIAARTGCELNFNDICSDVEISNPTAQSWLSILCNTNLVYLLQPFSNNNVSRIVKRPKIYFLDTGLASYLVGYTDAVMLEKSAYNGAIFETYVVSEIIKSFANKGLSPKRYLYYYRDNNGREIDLLINYNNTLYPVEIKKSKNPKIDAIKHFEILKRFNVNVGVGSVLCMVNELFPLNSDNYLVPIEYI